MNIEDVFLKQKEFYNKHIIDDVNYRLKKLKLLKGVIKENENKIYEALKLDLGKSNVESYMTEVGMVLEDLSYVIKHFKKWCKDDKVSTPLAQFPSKSYIKKIGYGRVLIISPWNYPFLLSIQPLVGAIAAGNTVILKPSEYSINTTKVIKEILSKVFKNEYVYTAIGDKEIAEQLLKLKFDYIFYTGSTKVGKIVMENAAKNLVPVTLELGGKSPCIIDNKSNVKLAAKRIVFGKLLNAGQTCVAPDYVLVDKDVKKEFISYLIKYIKEFLGDNTLENTEYPKIISNNHFERLINLIEKTKANKNSKLLFGGNYDKDTLKIEPTIIEINNKVLRDDSKLDILNEEIFGPILPIIETNNIEEAAQYINKKERPLALYLFTNNKKNEEYILNNIKFGGGCINDTVIHLANSKLPFGGIGNSGLGNYHGKFSFDTFTHNVSIVKKSTLIDLPMRYHPYTKFNEKIIKMFMK